MPEAKRARLLRSWARPFAEQVMPLIDEEVFRDAYHQDNGRPNYPVRVLIGLHLLKEACDLTDVETVEQFEFNLQWHHALGVTAEEAHVAERTLRNFRHRMMQDGRAQRSFELLTQRLAEHDGIDLGQQRFDSTHIMSTIRTLNRLGLFCETVRAFVANLDGAVPEAATRLPAEIRARYLERSGYFADAKREQARRRLPVVANDMYLLLGLFGSDAAVAALKSYQLMQRLFDEQCSVVQGTVCIEQTSEGAGDGGDNDPGDDAPNASDGASGGDDGADHADSDNGRDSTGGADSGASSLDASAEHSSDSAGGADSADSGASSLDASDEHGSDSAGGADSAASSLDASDDNADGGAASDTSATSAACSPEGGKTVVQIIDAGWPRAVSRPGLPQIRTCAIHASGSSKHRFATRGPGLSERCAVAVEGSGQAWR
ncbi:MAG: transposase [Thermomicrobiales bacterium]|nr:transposase [Thermomicrobiales bacterium]